MPISETVLNPYNLIMVAITIMALVLVNALMHPKGEHVVCVDASLLAEDPEPEKTLSKTPAEKMENSPIIDPPQ